MVFPLPDDRLRITPKGLSAVCKSRLQNIKVDEKSLQNFGGFVREDILFYELATVSSFVLRYLFLFFSVFLFYYHFFEISFEPITRLEKWD